MSGTNQNNGNPFKFGNQLVSIAKPLRKFKGTALYEISANRNYAILVITVVSVDKQAKGRLLISGSVYSEAVSLVCAVSGNLLIH